MVIQKKFEFCNRLILTCIEIVAAEDLFDETFFDSTQFFYLTSIFDLVVFLLKHLENIDQ